MSYNFKKYAKRAVALSLLQEAIVIYKRGNNFFAALHLAGAADEVLGKYLDVKGIKHSLKTKKDAFILISKELYKREIEDNYVINFLNKAKNSIKHLDAKDKNDHISMDPKEEAKDMIDRAITNWWLLEEELTPEMEDFFEIVR